jgi:hypothetical protein
VEDEKHRRFDAREELENVRDRVGDDEVGSEDADAREQAIVGVELLDEEVVISAERGAEGGAGECIAAGEGDADGVRVEGRENVRCEGELRSREHGLASDG